MSICCLLRFDLSRFDGPFVLIASIAMAERVR